MSKYCFFLYLFVYTILLHVLFQTQGAPSVREGKTEDPSADQPGGFTTETARENTSTATEIYATKCVKAAEEAAEKVPRSKAQVHR